MPTQTARKSLLSLLAVIGGGTVIYFTGVAALHVIRNLSPDRQTVLTSPDGRNRIVVSEQYAGFLGSACIKQVYVVRAPARLDRNDESNQVFVGGCDGLIAINWNGARVEGDIALADAVKNVNALTLKSQGADGRVQVSWAAH